MSGPRSTTNLGAIRYEPEESPWTPVDDADFLLMRTTRMACNRGSPEQDGGPIGFEPPDQPFAGILVPNQPRHISSAAAPSKSAHDKELVHLTGADVAQPLLRRSDQGKASDRIANLRQVGVVAVRPN